MDLTFRQLYCKAKATGGRLKNQPEHIDMKVLQSSSKSDRQNGQNYKIKFFSQNRLEYIHQRLSHQNLKAQLICIHDTKIIYSVVSVYGQFSALSSDKNSTFSKSAFLREVPFIKHVSVLQLQSLFSITTVGLEINLAFPTFFIIHACQNRMSSQDLTFTLQNRNNMVKKLAVQITLVLNRIIMFQQNSYLLTRYSKQ